MNTSMRDEDAARRRLLQIGVASLAAGLAGCGSGGSDPAPAPTPSAQGGDEVDATPPDTSMETPVTTAPETEEPVVAPTDCDSLTPTPAFPAGVRYAGNGEERVDVTEGRTGPTLELRLRLVDAASCQPLSSVVVDLWNADLDGRYSGASDATTYARGRQITDADGRVSFVTLYPGPDGELPPLVRFTVLFGAFEAFTSALFMNIDDAIEVYGVDTPEARQRGLTASFAYNTTAVPEPLIIDTNGPMARRTAEFDVVIDLDTLAAPPCEGGSPGCGADEPVTPPVDEPDEPTSPPTDGSPPLIDPESAQAQALQYVIRSTVDGQRCGTCALYQGAPGSTAAGCPLFPGLRTRAEAVCSAYVPRA